MASSNTVAKSFFLWLPLAALAVSLCLILCIVLRFVNQNSAIDSQIQIAENYARLLQSGKEPIEVVPADQIAIEDSLSIYTVVYNTKELPVVGNGFLHGSLPNLPTGVLLHSLTEDAYTYLWEPEKGVRQSLAIVAYTNGYVVVGKSLQQEDRRMSYIMILVCFGLAFSLAVSFILILILRYSRAL